MPKLFIYPNHQILLDIQDLTRYAQFQWFLDKDSNVYRQDDILGLKLNLAYQIAALLKFNPYSEVTFKDENRLNLKRSNLVELPVKLGKQYSQYKGITFDVNRGKWIAQLSINSNRVLYARCNSESQALEKLNQVRELHGLARIA